MTNPHALCNFGPDIEQRQRRANFQYKLARIAKLAALGLLGGAALSLLGVYGLPAIGVPYIAQIAQDLLSDATGKAIGGVAALGLTQLGIAGMHKFLGERFDTSASDLAFKREVLHRLRGMDTDIDQIEATTNRANRKIKAMRGAMQNGKDNTRRVAVDENGTLSLTDQTASNLDPQIHFFARVFGRDFDNGRAA